MQRFSRIYYISTLLIWILLAGLYIILTFSNNNIELPRIPFLVSSVIISVLYLFLYRRETLFCYETFFFIFFILSVYFYDIVIDNLADARMISPIFFNNSFPISVKNRALLLSTLSLLTFILSSVRTCSKQLNDKPSNMFVVDRDYTLSINILSFFIGIYLCYLFFNGTISTWFHYSSELVDYNNTAIVYLTMLFIPLSAMEFSRLNSKNCSSLKNFIVKVNKVYLVEIVIICTLLLISGNRNECMLILLPMIISYHVFISPFRNKQFMVLCFVGVSIMVLVGLIRQTSSLEVLHDNPITLFEITRDFGFVDNNTQYLMDYADKNGSIGFKNAFINIVSSVPLLGGIVVGSTGIVPDARSTDVTTIGMQLASNMDSGLGTSLIGDLYYTGGLIFVLLFMSFLGWLLSKLYVRFMIQNKYNIYKLVIYLFMFANVVYYIRAEWTMPLRYLGFSLIIVMVLRFIQPFNSIKY